MNCGGRNSRRNCRLRFLAVADIIIVTKGKEVSLWVRWRLTRLKAL